MSWYKHPFLNSSEYINLLLLASVRVDNHEGGLVQGMPILGGKCLLYEQRLFDYHRQ